jgi:hypothetical protein
MGRSESVCGAFGSTFVLTMLRNILPAPTFAPEMNIEDFQKTDKERSASAGAGAQEGVRVHEQAIKQSLRSFWLLAEEPV